MKYFGTLPNVIVTDEDNNSIALKNLLIRTELLPKLSKNPLIYYKYTIQDGDTPEIIADKYYGDPYRYWILLYGNPNILDAQTDWPMDSRQFNEFLISKYSEDAGGAENVVAYTQGTIHHYEKVVTTIDNDTQTQAIKNIIVDEDTYNDIIPFSETKSFPDGSSTTLVVSKEPVYIYNYEQKLNESKRNINIINSKYVTQLESQYRTLVNT